MCLPLHLLPEEVKVQAVWRVYGTFLYSGDLRDIVLPHVRSRDMSVTISIESRRSSSPIRPHLWHKDFVT
ncbi:hypothetical protein HAX54_034704, partial [Datura stramonium]|nr:hypothetical protein [Datura stramonium]